MKPIVLDITLIEPVLIADVGAGDPNSAVSLSYIPGSTLRGALIGQYLNTHSDIDLLDDDAGYRLFFDGSVKYLNAYPTKNYRRLLPVPLSWRLEKGTEDDMGSKIYDFAVEDTDVKQPKKVKSPFCSLSEKEVRLFKPEQQMNIHIYRDQRNQQTDADSIYRYEALAAGQTMRAVILAENDMDAEMIRDLLQPITFQIGKSRQAGYGLVEVKESSTPWQGEYDCDDEDDNEEKIIVTCLSDVVIRNNEGQYSTDLSTVINSNHKTCFVTEHIIGGFNRKWGLPLPQMRAIKAGSVFVYKYDETLLVRLKQFVETGIGERLVEGFGRIAVNWQQHDKLTKNSHETREEPLSQSLQGDSATLAYRISERVLRQRLDAALSKRISQLSFGRNSLSNSQLSRLRTVVTNARHENKIAPVKEHLEGLNKPARTQFEKTRFENKSFNRWLETLLSDTSQVWQELKAESPRIGEQQAEYSSDLAIEYTLRLINGVVQRGYKEGGQHE